MNNDNKIVGEFIANKICEITENKVEVNNTEDLISSHILGSISFVKLVSVLEKEFDIEFDISDLNVDNFRTINLITENILKYTKGV